MKQIDAKCFGAHETFGAALAALFHEPRELLIRRWNWKSALFSSLCRAAVFLGVNWSAGPEAATGAMMAEFAYRACTAGFAGALTQAFRNAKPQWVAAMTIPVWSHVLEFLIHWLRGTPNLRLSIGASLIFTTFSTLFNLHAMRSGVLVVGRGSKSLLADMAALPMVVFSFVYTGMGLLPATGRDRREWS